MQVSAGFRSAKAISNSAPNPRWRAGLLCLSLLLSPFVMGCRGELPLDPAAPLPIPTLPPTSTPDPWAALGAPARIAIPDIEVDAPLERLALRGDQKIAVPVDWDHAGWYEAGFRPGEPGSAVVSGHFDDDKGAPAVFHQLGLVQKDAPIIITYPSGERYVFRVDRTDLVDVVSVDRSVYDSIFGPAGEARLSLVTCDGAWNAEAGGYDKRFIVHARLDAEASSGAP